MTKSEDMEAAAKILRRAHAIAKKKDRVTFWISHAIHRYGQQQNDLAKRAESITFTKMVLDSGQILLSHNRQRANASRQYKVQ